MDWKKYFKRGTYVIVSTSSIDGTPNACVAECQGAYGDDKLLLSDCQMIKTVSNLMENPKVCVIGDDYHRLSGKAELFSSGEFIDIIKQRDPTIASGEFIIRHAIVISIDEVRSLDSQKIIYKAQ